MVLLPVIIAGTICLLYANLNFYMSTAGGKFQHWAFTPILNISKECYVLHLHMSNAYVNARLIPTDVKF